MSTTEDEFSSLRELYDKSQDENRKLAVELETVKAKIPPPNETENENENENDPALTHDQEMMGEEMIQTPPDTEDQSNNEEKDNEAEVIKDPELPMLVVNQPTLNVVFESDNESDVTSMSTSTTTEGSIGGDADEEHQNYLTVKLEQVEQDMLHLRSNYESLKETNGSLNSELTVAQEQLCEALKLLDEKCRLLEETEKKGNEVSESDELNELDLSNKSGQDPNLNEEIVRLTQDKETLSSENLQLRADLASHLQVIEDYEQKQMAASNASTLVGSVRYVENPSSEGLEKSLCEAEAKISELLKVKEKFAEVSAENSALNCNLSSMQQEMNLMSMQTKTATACAFIPVAIVLLAILASYIPFLPNFF